MRKITFIGAGSIVFTRALIRDLLTFPAFADATICLMDIHEGRLAMARRAAERIIAEGHYPATVVTTLNRQEALEGADAVLVSILATPVSVWRTDIEIPMKYGVDLCVGDTRGPAAVLRFLRTAPILLSIARDVEAICPQALLLNYTNPMAMLCRLIQSQTNVRCTGLCHSVQGTAEMLAGWIGAPMEEVDYLCAGINHQAFYLEYTWNGQDAYPLLRQAMERPEVYDFEIVRNEMFKHLGYYVTESSGHNSEYVSWFRKRPDLMKRYCEQGTGWNTGVHAYIIKEYTEKENSWEQLFQEWLNGTEPLDLKRGHEYAAYILNAVIGDGTPYRFNGNVRNFGLIDNLPEGCCVEVPIYADRRGFNPIHVGKLPTQLAALNSISAQNEEMAVEAFINGDPNLVFHANAFDPLTSAVLSLEEIRNMTNEMLDVSKEYLTMPHVVTI